MLILVSVAKGAPIVFLLNKEEVTIGRAEKDIVVNDASVSRGM
jgi:hypothetical protein